MPWECAECHTPEGKGVRIDKVCHHCGKPLCRDDRVLILDYVFKPIGEVGAEAVHCRSCKSEHHGIGDISL
jgi:hypothetical protein